MRRAWLLGAHDLRELDAIAQLVDGRPADVPTAIVLSRMRTLDEMRGQLARRLEWSGMLDP